MSFRNRVITKASIGFALVVIIGVSLTAFFVSTDINDGRLYLVVPEFSKRVGDPLLYNVFDLTGPGFCLDSDLWIHKDLIEHHLYIYHIIHKCTP